MRFYYFTEQPYPAAWTDEQGSFRPSLRINLPNGVFDPAIAADLFDRYYAEWQLADELGFDIMVNEHHQTATCMSATVVVALTVLARSTKRARLLALGFPIANRSDPLRVAEEIAMIDVLSRGRLDMGFVRGVPFEVAPSNISPVRQMDRFWEAHDFIIKALTTHDGPFNWESENFHYRQVNIWPRPFQQPHPPVWVPTASKSTARLLGEKGCVMATMTSGYNTRALFDAYREGFVSKGRKSPGLDRFAYLGLVAVAKTEAEARQRGELLASYLRTGALVHAPFYNPPGYLSAEDNAKLLAGMAAPRTYTKDGRTINIATASVQELIDGGILFCGTPSQVFSQIVDFCEHCGGMGNLLMMGHAGNMSHDDTVDNLTLFAKEVMPRLKDYRQPVIDITEAA